MTHHTIQPISPTKTLQSNALSVEPKTKNEKLLLAALLESEARVQLKKSHVLELQAANVLNEMYCDLLHRQLFHREEKKNQLKGKGRLVGDRLPRLLSGDEFYECVVEFTRVQEQEEREKAARKEAKKGCEGVMAAWQEWDEACKAKNEAKLQRYCDAVWVWEEAKALTKVEKQRFEQPKPKLEKIVGTEPKPPLIVTAESSSDEGPEEDEEDEEDKDWLIGGISAWM